MIYVAMAVNKETADEWVMSTHDTAEQAATAVDSYRTDDRFDYRVDTITDKRKVKLILNSLYGKSLPVGVNGTHYVTTDSVREYTIDDLFPQGTHAVAPTLTCSECACEVKNALNPYLIKHTDWHNKLLP